MNRVSKTRDKQGRSKHFETGGRNDSLRFWLGILGVGWRSSLHIIVTGCLPKKNKSFFLCCGRDLLGTGAKVVVSTITDNSVVIIVPRISLMLASTNRTTAHSQPRATNQHSSSHIVLVDIITSEASTQVSARNPNVPENAQ